MQINQDYLTLGEFNEFISKLPPDTILPQSPENCTFLNVTFPEPITQDHKTVSIEQSWNAIVFNTNRNTSASEFLKMLTLLVEKNPNAIVTTLETQIEDNKVVSSYIISPEYQTTVSVPITSTAIRLFTPKMSVHFETNKKLFKITSLNKWLDYKNQVKKLNEAKITDIKTAANILKFNQIQLHSTCKILLLNGKWMTEFDTESWDKKEILWELSKPNVDFPNFYTCEIDSDSLKILEFGIRRFLQEKLNF